MPRSHFAYLSVVFILAFSNPTPQSLLPAGEIKKISVYISPFQCVCSYCSVTRQIINNVPCVVLSRASVITAPFLALFIRKQGENYALPQTKLTNSLKQFWNFDISHLKYIFAFKQWSTETFAHRRLRKLNLHILFHNYF